MIFVMLNKRDNSPQGSARRYRVSLRLPAIIR